MAIQPQSCDGSELGALHNDLQNHPTSWRLSPQFREEEAKTTELVKHHCACSELVRHLPITLHYPV